MRDYSKISPAFWRSPNFQKLQSDDSRLAFVYMLTCEHQNSAGAYRLPPAYAADDLAWERDRFVAARDQVTAAGLIEFDPKTDEILINRWFKHNKPMNPDHRKGIVAILERLESERLYSIGVMGLEEVALGKVSSCKVNGAAHHHHPTSISSSQMPNDRLPGYSNTNIVKTPS